MGWWNATKIGLKVQPANEDLALQFLTVLGVDVENSDMVEEIGPLSNLDSYLSDGLVESDLLGIMPSLEKKFADYQSKFRNTRKKKNKKEAEPASRLDDIYLVAKKLFPRSGMYLAHEDGNNTDDTYYRYEVIYSAGKKTEINCFYSYGDDINVDIEKRKQNAASLLQGLGAAAAIDSDILIMGDLNAEIDEESLQQIINAGYEEQLLKYYTGAMYTHCYGDGSLIDHVMANNTMAAQVKNAEIMHVANVCSTGSKWNAYSDHDPYMVTLDLKESEFQCVDIAFSESFSDDFGKFSTVNVAGTKNWFVNTSYHYANMNAYGDGVNDDWLISPKFDLRQKSSATLKFNHCAGYGVRDNWINEMKVLVSDNYFDHLGNPGDATWTDLGAAFDTSGNWKWKNNTITIPSQFIGKDKVYVAFHYTCSDSNIPSWEVKNVELTATCTETGIHTVSAERWSGGFRKVMENGRLVIMTPDGKRYTLQGIEQR